MLNRETDSKSRLFFVDFRTLQKVWQRFHLLWISTTTAFNCILVEDFFLILPVLNWIELWSQQWNRLTFSTIEGISLSAEKITKNWFQTFQNETLVCTRSIYVDCYQHDCKHIWCASFSTTYGKSQFIQWEKSTIYRKIIFSFNHFVLIFLVRLSQWIGCQIDDGNSTMALFALFQARYPFDETVPKLSCAHVTSTTWLNHRHQKQIHFHHPL